MTSVPPILSPAGVDRSATLADQVEALENEDILRLFAAAGHELVHRRQRAGKTAREIVDELVESIEDADRAMPEWPAP